jgi:hypothetical protein
MPRAIERRLSQLEELIPPRLTCERFAARVSEHASRCGVSPGSALVTVLEDLSVRQLELLLEELERNSPVRSNDESPEAIRRSLIEAGFSPNDVELLVRRFGEHERPGL